MDAQNPADSVIRSVTTGARTPGPKSGRKLSEPWAGGRCYLRADGKKTWIIEKMVAGIRYQVALDVTSEEDAEIELRDFKKDPAGYRNRTALTTAVHLNADTIQDFCAALVKKGRTPDYITNTATYLGAWMDKLGANTDLASLDPRQVVRIVKKEWETAEQKRIAALKSFCSFLIEQGLLDPVSNPARSLKVPPPTPEINVREKLFTVQQVQAAYAAMDDQVMRDLLRLRISTGIRGSEISNLIAGGELGKIEYLTEEYGEIAGVLVVRPKNRKAKKPHRISVNAATLAAAERLQKAGPQDKSKICVQFQRVGKSIGVEDFNPSTCRHTFITLVTDCGRLVYPKNQGLDIEVAAAVVGHTSTQMTRTRYNQSKVPAMVVLPISLEHPDDPTPITTRVKSTKPALALATSNRVG